VLFNKLLLVAIRSLIRGYLFNHFSLPIITFRFFPMDILINILILKRFVNNMLSKFIYLDKRGGREVILFLKEG